MAFCIATSWIGWLSGMTGTSRMQSAMKSFTHRSYSAASAVKRALSISASIALFWYEEMLKIELLPWKFQ